MLPFRLLRRQAEATAYNRAASAESNFRRETSVTGAASRLTAEANRRGEQAVRGRWKKRRAYTGSVRAGRTVAEKRRAAPVFTADGYRRKTPVQPICEAPGYRRGRILWVVWSLVAVAALAFIIYYLVHSGVLSR